MDNFNECQIFLKKNHVNISTMTAACKLKTNIDTNLLKNSEEITIANSKFPNCTNVIVQIDSKKKC